MMDTQFYNAISRDIAIDFRKKGLIPEDIEDLLHEALIIFLQKAEEVQNPFAYIKQIIMNLYYSIIRRDKKDRKITHALTERINLDFLEETHRLSENKKWDISIKEINTILEPDQRELFKEYQAVNFNGRELARTIGANYNTIKTKVAQMNSCILAYYLIQSGVVISKNLLNNNQKRNFNIFLDKFKQACNNKDETLIKSYFLPSLNPIDLQFSISNIHKIDFSKDTSNDCFNCNVFYDKPGIDLIMVRFKIIFIPRLQVISQPLRPKGMKKLPSDIMTKEFGEQIRIREGRKKNFSLAEKKRLYNFHKEKNRLIKKEDS